MSDIEFSEGSDTEPDYEVRIHTEYLNPLCRKDVFSVIDPHDKAFPLPKTARVSCDTCEEHTQKECVLKVSGVKNHVKTKKHHLSRLFCDGLFECNGCGKEKKMNGCIKCGRENVCEECNDEIKLNIDSVCSLCLPWCYGCFDVIPDSKHVCCGGEYPTSDEDKTIRYGDLQTTQKPLSRDEYSVREACMYAYNNNYRVVCYSLNKKWFYLKGKGYSKQKAIDEATREATTFIRREKKLRSTRRVIVLHRVEPDREQSEDEEE